MADWFAIKWTSMSALYANTLKSQGAGPLTPAHSPLTPAHSIEAGLVVRRGLVGELVKTAAKGAARTEHAPIAEQQREVACRQVPERHIDIADYLCATLVASKADVR